MRWLGYVARIIHVTNAYEILFGKTESKGPLERPRRRGKGIVKLAIKKQDTKMQTGFSWLQFGISFGLL